MFLLKDRSARRQISTFAAAAYGSKIRIFVLEISRLLELWVSLGERRICKRRLRWSGWSISIRLCGLVRRLLQGWHKLGRWLCCG